MVGIVTMGQVRGKFSRQYQGIGYNALVNVEVAEDTRSLCDDVQFAENWHGYRDNNWVGDGDEDWKQGAVLGVQYALHVAEQKGRCVTVISVNGNHTVTNPTIVAAAAIDGVWQGVGYQPRLAEVQWIEEIVFSSWQHPDATPDFERKDE